VFSSVIDFITELALIYFGFAVGGGLWCAGRPNELATYCIRLSCAFWRCGVGVGA
jgi:hypothetical protein